MSTIMRKLRYVANQNPILGPVIVSISELIKVNPSRRLEETRIKQKKLSEITDMIHAAHVFHRSVRDKTTDRTLHQESIMSLLFGDYLLAQSSVDMADLRVPRTVGLIAKGLEDYTRGEFLKLNLFAAFTDPRNEEETSSSQIPSRQQLNDEINRYAKLTCGSLLSNACLSAALLAGHPDRVASDSNSLSNLVYTFGLHTGTAHRLLELFHNPDTNSEADRKFIKANLKSTDFESLILGHVSKSIELLFDLPDGNKRQTLLTLLDSMKAKCLAT